MHRITLILLLALLLPDLYIYLVYIVRRTKNFVRRAAYWLPSAILVLLYLYLIYLTGDNALAHHPQAIGRLAIAVMAHALLTARHTMSRYRTLFVSCRTTHTVSQASGSFYSSSCTVHHSRLGTWHCKFRQCDLWCHSRHHAFRSKGSDL